MQRFPSMERKAHRLFPPICKPFGIPLLESAIKLVLTESRNHHALPCLQLLSRALGRTQHSSRQSSARESKRSSSQRSETSSTAGNFNVGWNPFVAPVLSRSMFDRSAHYLPIRTSISFASIRKSKAAPSLPRSSTIF